MSYLDFQTAQHVMLLQHIVEQRQIESQNWPRGIAARQPGWWSWQRDRLLNQIGRRLTSLGQRLEQYGLTQISA